MDLYNHIEELAKKKGIKSVQQLCEQANVSRSIMTELRKGRSKTISQKTAEKLCVALDVSMDELLGTAPAPERPVTDDDIKFALFGGGEEITDEMYEEVKRFAAFVKQRGKQQ